MRVAWAPLEWFQFRDRYDHVWSVWLSSHDISPELYMDGNPAMGVTMFLERRILIDAGQPAYELRDTVNHELMHVSAWECTGEGEEKAISTISPDHTLYLERLGFKLPAFPDGFERLRRHARRVDRGH